MKFDRMRAKFHKWWQKALGSTAHFPLEARVFHAVMNILFVSMLIVAVANLFMGFYMLALLAMVIIALVSGLYILSRCYRKFRTASIAFILLSYIMAALNYLFNSGIDGPIVYAFLMTFLFAIIVSPRRLQPVWIIAHLLVVPGLFVLELYYPGQVVNVYRSPESRIIDHLMVYVPVIIVFYITINFVRKAYYHEKLLTKKALAAIAEKNKELERLNGEKDRLFSIIGHDLRTPLSAIQEYLEILGYSHLEEEQRLEFNRDLLELTNSTSHLLSNLLHWSTHTMSGPVPLLRLDIRELIGEIMPLLTAQASRKTIALHLEIPEGLPPVLADKDMLQLVIRNIAGNAIKFTRSGGKVTLCVSSAEDYLLVSVKDNGVGIPGEQQKDLFSSAARSTTGTNQEKGVGLGLVLCYDFIRAMQGTIDFKSKTGEGTEFIIRLKKG